MKLAVWTYEGPPHVGAMRVATAMEGLHYVLHAPQGDTYADLLFTMIERRDRRPPVTYTTFQARDLGSDTAELFKTAARDAYERFQPQAMIVGASCTAELIQDDPGGLARALALPIPVIPLDLPSYQKKETWGAAETFYALVRNLAAKPADERAPGAPPSCNILGPTALGFRHRDDLVEVRRILDRLGVSVNVVAPLGATPADLARLPDAGFNVVLYPEIASTAAAWLEKTHRQPAVRIAPVGLHATREFIREVARLAGVDAAPALDDPSSRSGWWSRSVDSTYLTAKRVFVFGEANRAIAAARVARDELGFEVVGLGAYNREFAREVRAAAEGYGLTALVTDDYLEVERAIAEAQPELVLGTQMERHIAKRLAHRLRGDLRPGARAGLPGPPLAPDGVRGRQRAVRHLGAPAGDGAGGAPPGRCSATTSSSTTPPARPIWAHGHAAPAPAHGARRRRHGRLRADPLDRRGHRRARQDPVLRARQGPPQHGEVRRRERGLATITVDTLYDAKAISAAARAHARARAGGGGDDGQPSVRRGRPRLRGHCAARHARPPAGGARGDDEWGSQDRRSPRCHRRHRPAATWSSRPCCSSRTTSAPCSRLWQPGATHCDAMLCCMSANEVTRLTRLGRFDMAQEADRRARHAEEAARRQAGRARHQRRGLGRAGADAPCCAGCPS